MEEEILAKNREIYTLQEQIQRLQKELEMKTEMAASAQMMQAEMDESHINEIKLLEQVEQVSLLTNSCPNTIINVFYKV